MSKICLDLMKILGRSWSKEQHIINLFSGKLSDKLCCECWSLWPKAMECVSYWHPAGNQFEENNTVHFVASRMLHIMLNHAARIFLKTKPWNSNAQNFTPTLWDTDISVVTAVGKNFLTRKWWMTVYFRDFCSVTIMLLMAPGHAFRF